MSRHATNLAVYVKRLNPNAVVPAYAKLGDAGADLVTTQPVYLLPGQRTLVSTGIAVEIPDGYVGLVHPRSGLAVNHGLTVLNAPGTIDSGYRGEIKVCLINHGAVDVRLEPGDRIAQLVIQEVSRVCFIEAEHLTPSERGEGGFGSTGGKTAGWRSGVNAMGL